VQERHSVAIQEETHGDILLITYRFLLVAPVAAEPDAEYAPDLYMNNYFISKAHFLQFLHACK